MYKELVPIEIKSKKTMISKLSTRIVSIHGNLSLQNVSQGVSFLWVLQITDKAEVDEGGYSLVERESVQELLLLNM